MDAVEWWKVLFYLKVFFHKIDFLFGFYGKVLKRKSTRLVISFKVQHLNRLLAHKFSKNIILAG